VGETISLNIGTLNCPKNVKRDTQYSDEEKLKFIELLVNFKMFLLGLMRIFVVLILLLYNIPFLSRRE
jgi:hypothetical protein